MSTPPPTLPADRATDLAVDLLDAMLGSASVDVIGRTAWWDRAQSALETGLSSGASLPEVVSTMARKLQIDGALSAYTADTVAQLGAALADPAVFGAWRAHTERVTPYVTALTRLRRKTRGTATPTAAAPAATADDPEGTLL